MNDYSDILKITDDERYLISMVSVNQLLRLGMELGLNKGIRVLDLCCGYGTVLKIWSEAFGISATGVDIYAPFLREGKKRLKKGGIDSVELIHKDVVEYKDDTKYDIVICSETIESFESTFKLGEKFLKKGGTLLYQKVFSTAPIVPEELDEFDGGVYPISRLNEIFNSLGWYILNLATGTENDWNRYHTESAHRDFERLCKNPEDTKLKNRIVEWNNMYFKYRMPLENQAMFCLKKLSK